MSKTPKTDAFVAALETELGDGPPHLSQAAIDVAVRLRLIAFARELENASQSEAEQPVAYAIRAKSDGSYFEEMIPVGYATFEDRMKRLRSNGWVVNGKAEVVPLYAAPTRSVRPTDTEESK